MREGQEKKGKKVRPRPLWRQALPPTSGASSAAGQDLPQEMKRPTLYSQVDPTFTPYDVLGYNWEGKITSPPDETKVIERNMQPSTCCVPFLIAEMDCFGRKNLPEKPFVGSIGSVVFLTTDDEERDSLFQLARRHADGSRSVFDANELKTKLKDENFWFFPTDDVHQVFWN